MSGESAPKPVERLFPYARRARILLPGRGACWRGRSRLQWLLLATDIADRSRRQVIREFAPYPIVEIYDTATLDGHFGTGNTRVLGFAKSDLAKSIYAELKAHRINKPGPGGAPGPASGS